MIAPQNLEAEESVLGAMLVNVPAISAVTDTGLAADDFYRDSHRAIFRAILSLTDRNEAVDPLTVSVELEKRGELETAGGTGYVHTLAAKVPAVAHARQYSRVVLEQALVRETHKESRALLELDVWNGQVPAARERLGVLVERAESSSSRAIADLSLIEVMERELPPEEWIVPDLIAPATIAFLHGLPETFKTFIALHVAFAVAGAGRQAVPPLALGRLPVEFGGAVGYCWQDDSEVEELRRVQAVARAASADPELPLYFLLNAGMRIDRAGDLERLRRWIDRRGLKLVVLDSLKDFIGEGSTRDDAWVVPALNDLKALSDDVGVAWWIVHHDHKLHADTKGRSAGQTMHGSTFLEASARSGLHCQRPDPVKPEVKLSRWGNSGKPWGPHLLRLDQDTCELELVELAHNEPKVAPLEYVDTLRAAGGGMFVVDLAEKLGVSSTTARKNAERAGAEIVSKRRGRTSANYALLPGVQEEPDVS